MADPLIFHLENVVRDKRSELGDFEGPLDLILDLLRRNKIEIADLKISLLLRQYLEWIEARRSMDLEVASDFISMASHLVYLKTKMLISVGEEPDEEVGELISALEDKLRSEKLKNIEPVRVYLEEHMEYGRCILTKPREYFQPDKTYKRIHHISDLTAALMGIFERTEKKPPQPPVFKAIVGREPYPVSEKSEHIIKWLIDKGKIQLRSIILSARSRSEAIAAFLAVLELCRNSHIRLFNEEDDYIIELAPGYKNNPGRKA